MAPELSVIIPVYNVENYLTRCVDSIRKQTFTNLEIILIDDGSTDESGRLCDELAKEDSRIKVIHKENEGQGIARNCGLDIALGTYVAFVDSDDFMEKDTYEYTIQQMKESDAEVACFGYIKEDNKGQIVDQTKIRDKVYRDNEIKRKFALHFFGDDPNDDDLRGVSACMSVYRMDIVRKHGVKFPSERAVFSEDTIFNLEYCRYIKAAVAINKMFYHYCLKEDSFSRGYQKERLTKAEAFVDLLTEYAQQFKIEELVVNRIRTMLWIIVIDAIKQEVRFKQEKSIIQIRSRIKEICNRNCVACVIREINIHGFNHKQKIFYYGVKYKQYLLLIFLAYLRNRRGL